MEIFIDFLVGHYFWFLIITIVLFFALVGYIVDSKEQKTATVFDSPLEMQRNLTNLAVSAQNKTMGDVIPNSQAMNYGMAQNMNQPNSMNPNSSMSSQMNYGQMQNYNQNQNFNPVSNGQNANMNMGVPPVHSAPSFEILNK